MADRFNVDPREMNMNSNQALKQYNHVNVQTSITDADPHKLIDLLYSGFIERVAQARVAIVNDKTEIKGQKISKAIDILTGLRSALDFEQGQDIAAQLDSLYEYMMHQLIDANINNNIHKCDEVTSLMKTIKDAWVAIKSEGLYDQESKLRDTGK